MFVTDNVALSINLLSLSVNRCWLQVVTMIKHKVLLVPLCDIGLCSGEGILLPTQSEAEFESQTKVRRVFLLAIHSFYSSVTVIEKGENRIENQTPFPMA